MGVCCLCLQGYVHCSNTNESTTKILKIANHALKVGFLCIYMAIRNLGLMPMLSRDTMFTAQSLNLFYCVIIGIIKSLAFRDEPNSVEATLKASRIRGLRAGPVEHHCFGPQLDTLWDA